MNKEINYVKEFYTTEDLSKEIGINERVLREYIKAGKLKASKIGKRYIITRDSINKMLKEHITK